APRRAVTTNLNASGRGGADTNNSAGSVAPTIPIAQRPVSTCLIATPVHVSASPSMTPNPADEDLVSARARPCDVLDRPRLRSSTS
ncbi:hypothetical protein FOMPIDRAFT_64558, partial [Fomitopsis schrenkii]